MLGLRLVRLIQKHSNEIAEGLMAKLLTSPRTQAYRNLREDEFRDAATALYAHLEEWLLNKTESDVERYFKDVGARRANDGIPASQMAWAINLSKAQLREFVYQESGADRALELYGELEFLDTLDRFFARAIYYALLGYEQHAKATKAA